MEMFSTWFSIILAVLVLIFNRGLLRLLFGSVENSVMESCITYLRILFRRLRFITRVHRFIEVWVRQMLLCIFLLFQEIDEAYIGFIYCVELISICNYACIYAVLCIVRSNKISNCNPCINSQHI